MTDKLLGTRVWLPAPRGGDSRMLAASTGLSNVLASALCSRGVTTPEEASAFLEPDLGTQWIDPEELPGMPEAAERVVAAIREGERIVVFGDFDLDGISAAAVAELGLRELGADVSATVPHRFREGYGLTVASVTRLLAMEPRLVVTVDCGISCAPEVAALRGAGCDVVVTDHHEPGDLLPDGVPVADPKLGSYGCELAGAGVALKLVQTVGARLGRPDTWRSLADLAALGTIADIVPMLSENRALVAEGLAAMREAPRPGIAALARVAGVEPAGLTSERVAFSLVPRLNAAGRVADPHQALLLLVTDDPERAAELAAALDGHNKVRQAAEQELFEQARSLAEARFRDEDRALVLAGEGWHDGVKGIVAARLASAYSVPAFLFTVEDGVARGSARTVGRIDIFSAVSACAELFERFGGHRAALGITMAEKDLPEFERRLQEGLRTLPDEEFARPAEYEAELELHSLGPELFAELELLEPHGRANPAPSFVTRGVFMNDRKRVGKTGDHLRFRAFDGESSLPSIAFRCRGIEELARHEGVVDLLYRLEQNEWRGKVSLQLKIEDFAIPEAPEGSSARLVRELFERADEILAREDYALIGDAESFNTKLAGVTFEERQDAVRRLAPGTQLRIERQPGNPHDPCACALFDPFGDQIGFFNRRLAAALAPLLDSGVEFDVEVTAVTGGDASHKEDRSLGVNVLVSRRMPVEEAEEAETAASVRGELAALGAAELDAELLRRLLPGRVAHPAQTEALTHLAEGRSTLAVMATGRGKSLVFHLHAARLALGRGLASVFVYPLRALVADQALYLEETLAPLGLATRTVTGETAPGARDEAFAELDEGSLDIVLTTPEFLVHHAERFVASGRVGFVAVDEAHHVAARANRRPAYSRMGEVLERLGGPVVFAATATCDEDAALANRDTLGVTQVVTDDSVRENLRFIDGRSLAAKDARVAELAAGGGKMIVYVNSRDTSVRVARALRQRFAPLRDAVAFYNGGLTRDVRHALERAFRHGDIRVVVATSAFGEGVNIPDVRHVVLYHLPFNDVEFNQMCGRCGRDGDLAEIHALYGPKDARLNELILESIAVERDDLAALYLVLRDLADAAGGDFDATNGELAERVRGRREGSRMTDKGVSTAVGILREISLIASEGAGSYRRLSLLPRPAEKLDLASSVRYSEGLEELGAFKEFREWALKAPADELLVRINRPILPARSQPPAAGNA